MVMWPNMGWHPIWTSRFRLQFDPPAGRVSNCCGTGSLATFARP